MKLSIGAVALTLAAAPLIHADEPAKRPNVLIIIADDQGYGDLACHGNPKIRTPNLDRLASQSTQLRHFYVCPVCAPTRSSLMTGRYNYRTGIVDTFVGRAMMHPDETTLAEMLGGKGYRTGIFGKWHLGDNYPLRPQDQGFQECLVLKGGGIGQASDPPGGSSYFDPILFHNGKMEKQKGYVSNVITDAAMEFISKEPGKPFFTYLAFNCPHTPLQVSDEDLKPYKEMNLGLDEFPKKGFPIHKSYSVDTTSRVYAMVSNLDANLGRLFAKLEEQKLADNTIVFFLTDNGPQQPRYNAGFRGLKGSVYEGGVRVPLYARWPGKFPASKGVDVVSAHIDIAPTVLEACGIEKPKGHKMDGISLLPELKGELYMREPRTIYLQWHRGNVPEMGRACTARGGPYKLVQAQGAFDPAPKNAVYELYDILKDPSEQHNIAEQFPDVVTRMREGYEEWFADVRKERQFLPPKIHLGTEHENPSVLTRQDWRVPNEKSMTNGHWEVLVSRPGKYRVTLYFDPADKDRDANAELGTTVKELKIPAKESKVVLDDLEWKQGEAKLSAYTIVNNKRMGVKYMEVERKEN